MPTAAPWNPSPAPTAAPIPAPSPQPSLQPIPSPSPAPIPAPSPQPSLLPIPSPSPAPSPAPIPLPTTHAPDSALGLSSSSTGIGITAIAAAELGNTLSSLLDSTLFVAEDENSTNATSAGASLGAAVDGILSAQLYGAVAGEYAQSIASANLRSSAQRLSPNATSPGETRSLVLDNSASAVELPASLAGDGSYDASLAEYTSDPYAGENRGPAVTSSVTRFGLTTSSSDEASSRRRARRPNATVGAGGPSPIVALVIGGGIAGRPKPPGANLTCACGFTGNVSFTCPDNTTIDHACDGLPGVEAVTCPATEDACASWNSSSQAWLAQCETVQGAGGTTTCECGVDTADDAPPLDYSTKEEKMDAGSVYFKNLTEPPDLSRAVVMIYALLALLLACVAAHAYGLRLDALDARRRACPDAKTLKYSSSACKLHADDDPYEAHGDYDVLMAGWKRNFFHAMDLGHPFYGWYTLYSASVPRPFRAWCCGFEILVFMYALAFETNLLFPDVEEECAGKLTPETCASLKTALRGKFRGTHVEQAPLCQWMPCAEACVMEEPGDDEMSPMPAARRPERGPARRDDGRARRYYLILAGMFLALLRARRVAIAQSEARVR